MAWRDDSDPNWLDKSEIELGDSYFEDTPEIKPAANTDTSAIKAPNQPVSASVVTAKKIVHAGNQVLQFIVMAIIVVAALAIMSALGGPL
jgi:hypothetical protein